MIFYSFWGQDLFGQESRRDCSSGGGMGAASFFPFSLHISLYAAGRSSEFGCREKRSYFHRLVVVAVYEEMR